MDYIDIFKELHYIEKQLSELELIAEYADKTHVVEFGKLRDQYFLKFNGTLVKISRDPKDVVPHFYGQIAQIHEDKESGIDPHFANLRDILVSRNKFVQDSLQKLGEGKLSKQLSQLNFNSEISSRSISKQLDVLDKYVDRDDILIKWIDPQDEVGDVYQTKTASFQKAMEIILNCKHCPKPYSPGLGKPDDLGNEPVEEGPKPNNSGMFTYSMEDNDADINMSTKAIILNLEGKILLLKDAYSEFWDLPGGHINDGETLDMGLKREVKEETGLTVTACEQRFARELLLGEPPPRIVVFYIASVVGDVQLSEEHTGAAWVTYDNLNKVNLGVFLPIVQQLMQETMSAPTTNESLLKDGHEMDVTDLGQPFYHQKHHQMDTYEMGEPDVEVDNIQRQRHEYMTEPLKISTVRDVLSDHVNHTDNPVIVKFNYSEAGGPETRERPFIEPETDASSSYEAGYVIPYSSAAQVDSPLEKQDGGAAGGAGVAGEGSGAVGNVGALTTGDTFTDTYSGGKRRPSDYDSSLTQKQDSTAIGTFEGYGMQPYNDSYEYEKPERTRHSGNRGLPNEQQPLGEGEDQLWLSEEEDAERSPNTRKVVVEGQNRSTITDESREQFTNLSSDFLSSFMKKSKDELMVITANAPSYAARGKSLVVAGYGNYFVVDREGHLISVDALRKALPRFMENPKYRNVNIFHSGVQVAELLPKFKDAEGKIWTTHVDDKGLFAVVEFRTDIEVARKAMAEVLKGNLRGFSLAGNSNVFTKTRECEHGICYDLIHDLEIYELTLCITPVNQKSYISQILQRPTPDQCPECYIQGEHVNNYNSSLQPIKSERF